MMLLVCTGLSHKTAPVQVREQLACPPERLSTLFSSLDQLAPAGICELAVLSTCNRLEIYAALDEDGPETGDALSELTSFMSHHWSLPQAALEKHLYFLSGQPAVAHLCRVACGLDSMVLGEPQILGQVAEAYRQAQEAGATGPLLEAAFGVAVTAGKRARTETRIGRHAGSVGSVAVRAARSVVVPLEQASVAVLGAGEMAKLVLLALRKRQLNRIALLNRTPEAAAELNDLLGASYPIYDLGEIPSVLATADIIITSTSATDTIISAPAVRRAMAGRPDRPLLIIDIAVPRDVAPEVTAVPGVHLMDLDDLQSHLDDALSEREAEIPQVEAIVAEMVAEFEARQALIEVAPLLRALRRKAGAIRERELARTLRYLPDLDAEAEAHVRQLANSLVNKLLHEPMVRLRHEARNGREQRLAAAVRELFDLAPEEMP